MTESAKYGRRGRRICHRRAIWGWVCAFWVLCAPPVYSQTSSGSVSVASSASTAPGCDVRIERALARASLDYIDKTTELARQFYRDLPEGGFGRLSCIDQLLSGINIVFAPPSIGAILSALQSRVCQIVHQHVQQALRPLHQSLSVGVDMDRLVPGIGLGRLTAGVWVSPHYRSDAPIIHVQTIGTPVGGHMPMSRGIFAR